MMKGVQVSRVGWSPSRSHPDFTDTRRGCSIVALFMSPPRYPVRHGLWISRVPYPSLTSTRPVYVGGFHKITEGWGHHCWVQMNGNAVWACLFKTFITLFQDVQSITCKNSTLSRREFLLDGALTDGLLPAQWSIFPPLMSSFQ